MHIFVHECAFASLCARSKQTMPVDIRLGGEDWGTSGPPVYRTV